jgi:carbonic anhydrase
MARVSADLALQRLREGNARYAAAAPTAAVRHAPRPDLVAGQAPFAVVLGCSDSRVPVEIVFDQGPGDLFVIRVAGNIVAESQIGSVEFAVERFGTRLVVVLGHTGCGAIQATLEEMQRPTSSASPNLGSIVDRVRHALQGLALADYSRDPEGLARRAVQTNVQVSARSLRSGSELLERLTRSAGLRIVGAEYALETGVVTFFDADLPDPTASEETRG